MKQIAIVLLVLLSIKAFSQNNQRTAAECEPPQSYADLDINNVRARIYNGGHLWWDLKGDPVYEVPQGTGMNSIFAGSLWIGGLDDNGQIHLAGQRYLQIGIDFWPGPLNVGGDNQAGTEKSVCREYDKVYVLYREDIKEFRAWFECEQSDDCDCKEEFPDYVIPESILNWPAHGPSGGYSYYLAPFYDVNNDGVYNPYDGDFPYFEFPEEGITDNPDCIDSRSQSPKLYGDQCIWRVFNDAGNEHGETGGSPLGFEFHAQSFAYADNSVLNDQTFYNYYIINRSTNAYHDVYAGMYTDSDLGGATDDRLGCDVSRGLGYTYNGDEFDDDYQGNSGYGENAPAMGIDFVSGMFADNNQSDDQSNWDIVNGVRVLDCSKADFMNGNINGQNFGDGIVDNERLGMSNFMPVHPVGISIGFPTYGDYEYYNYMQSIWHNGVPLTYGGYGYDPSMANEVTRNAFSGNPTTDPCGWGQDGQVMPGWSEENAGIETGDRRYVISHGPVTFEPGGVNNFTAGAIWARGNSGAYSSVEKLKKVDDAVQNLFDRCFRVLDGPDAPDLSVVELDGKLVLYIENSPASNNYLEEYKEMDPDIFCNDSTCDKYYRFQGYQIFQLKSSDIDFWEERYNSELVREVFQCDIRDNVTNLLNYKYNDDWSSITDQQEVEAENKGIRHSFEVTKDAFPWGENDQVVNHKEMHFVAIAYASNLENPYSPWDQTTFNGQKTTYLSTRQSPEIISATAHKPESENHGTQISSDYGTGVEITQLAGFGNGNIELELSDETIDEIMSGSPWASEAPVFKAGFGPVVVKVIDPLNIPADTYTLKFVTENVWSFGKIKDGAEWELINSSGEIVYSEQIIDLNRNEQVISQYGLSIEITQVEPAGYKTRNPEQNGYITSDIQFSDENKEWLAFLPDSDALNEYNWIRCGTYQTQQLEDPNRSYDDYIGFDSKEYFEKILGGTWAPYRLVSSYKYGPAFDQSISLISIDKYSPLKSIDLVITPDKDKWSRSVVLEMCENEWTVDDETGHPVEVVPLVNYRSEGNALRFDLRQHPSVDKEGNVIPGDTTHGLGWFPGYAIDVTSGERLNIAFGEDSWLEEENGADMIWNPTSSIAGGEEPIFGGMHYVYIMGHNEYILNPSMTSPAYDSCMHVYRNMRMYEESGNGLYKKYALMGSMWTAIPLLKEGFEHLVSEVRIRIRVATPYYQGKGGHATLDSINGDLPMYTFSTHDVASATRKPDIAESVLDEIRVVPNPYYGYSFYQSSGEQKVKITNLPTDCVVSVYDVKGSLIRRWEKHSDPSWIDWDLMNSYGHIISGGMYIIHIDAGETGEKVVKWFGAISEQ